MNSHKCIVVQSRDVMTDNIYLEFYAAVKHFKDIVKVLTVEFFTAAYKEAAIFDNEQPRESVEVTDQVDLNVLDAEDIALISGIVETGSYYDPLAKNLPTTPNT
jgi:hypothetical protein